MGCILFDHATPYSWNEAHDWCKNKYSLPCACPVDDQGFSTGFSAALSFFTLTLLYFFENSAENY